MSANRRQLKNAAGVAFCVVALGRLMTVASFLKCGPKRSKYFGVGAMRCITGRIKFEFF